MQRHAFPSLLAATAAVVVCCFIVPVHAFICPTLSHHRLVAPPPAHASKAALSRRRRQRAHPILYARLKNTGNKVDLDPDEIERLFQAFLRGDRSSMEQYEEQRRLQAEKAEEDTQGLWGKAKHVIRGIGSKVPLLFMAPLVLWVGFQLSGLAVALALTSAVVLAGFALPPMFALTFLIPLIALLTLGIFVFPIVPFAILGFLPGFALLPLLFLGGFFWLTQFSGLSSSISSRSSGGIVDGDDGSWPWGNSGFSWISINDEDGETVSQGMWGTRRAERGGVIDVKATDADDDEDEDGGNVGSAGRDLEDFDRRLRDRE
ncbi:hypothetical protein VYU27_008138 [Nannochloropsis oceanica]